MAVNERIQRTINDLPSGQLAPSQAARTEWYPGKARSRAGDMNWEKHYRCPVGLPQLEEMGPLEVEHIRVEKLGRSSVSDQTIPAPTVTGTKTTTITAPMVWGVTTPVHVVTETETAEEPAILERNAGSDGV
jgi:hypothetical protein